MPIRRSSNPPPRGASRSTEPSERRWSLPQLSLTAVRQGLAVLGLGVAGVALLFGVLELWRWCYPRLDQPLSRVEVTSELRYLPREEVEQALAGLVGARFFALELEQMRRALEALPWVARANVSRRWPDRLVLEISEQQPLARWGLHGLLNIEGELFEPQALSGFEQLPLLSGPEGSEALVMEQFHELGYLLRPLGLAISELRLSDRHTWTLKLGAVEVAMGGGLIEERLQRFVLLYRQQLKGCWSSVQRIDLRYDNGVAVSAREGCAA